VRPWIVRHLGLKLVSVALAGLLWLAIAGDPLVERSLRVPLEVQNIPADLEIVGEPPSTVEVRVRGPAGTLSQLVTGDVLALLDLKGARPGRRLFHLTTDRVRAPFGVEVTQIQPATVGLTLERSAARTVPVVPQLEGRPMPGFVVAGVEADPPTVEVVGPESRLHRVTEAITDAISVEAKSASFVERATVGVVDPLVRVRQPIAARVVVTIAPSPLERALRDVPVQVRHLAAARRAEVVPARVVVHLSGARQAIENLTEAAVTAYVDLAGLGSGRYNLPVRVEAAERLGVTRIDPSTVAVRIW
jgi:YbbR domain-containing protein